MIDGDDPWAGSSNGDRSEIPNHIVNLNENSPGMRSSGRKLMFMNAGGTSH